MKKKGSQEHLFYSKNFYSILRFSFSDIDGYENKLMNSNNSPTTTLMVETVDDESISIDDDMREIEYDEQSRTHITRSSAGSTSSNGTTTTTNTGPKRQKEMSPCYVCGAKAHGYNFDQSKKNLKIDYLMTSYFQSSYM
jgi:hypothetical protein